MANHRKSGPHNSFELPPFAIDRRRLLQRLGGGFLATMPWASLLAATTESRLHGFRMVQQENVMLHFDLDRTANNIQVYTLPNPDRLVIDFPNTQLDADIPTERFAEGVVKSVRFGVHEGYLRVVLDLRRGIEPLYRLVNRQRGQRLIVNLGVKGNPLLADYKQRLVEEPGLRDVIVVLDAGHGGKDPGAIGGQKTFEKDITLAIARRLYRRLEKQPGVKPVMLRDRDVYVALPERLRLTRSGRADLLISLHADAFKRREAKGSSVFALSTKGASSEAAAWLAKQADETAALFGDVTLEGMSADLKSTLLDLAQNSTLEASLDLGAEVLEQLKKVGDVHKSTVEQANFSVLRSPDIPSILVETAFISNPEEERKLNNPTFQDNLAAAIEAGVVRYLKRRAPSGTHLAANR